MTRSHGKIFILERDTNKDKKININDLEWDYLKGDGDFRSSEIGKLRDEADIIITNPPFSLFIPFLKYPSKVSEKVHELYDDPFIKNVLKFEWDTRKSRR